MVRNVLRGGGVSPSSAETRDASALRGRLFGVFSVLRENATVDYRNAQVLPQCTSAKTLEHLDDKRKARVQ